MEPYIARTQGDRMQIEMLELLKSIDKSLQTLNTEKVDEQKLKKKTVKKEVK